jgi:hypothetical protein
MRSVILNFEEKNQSSFKKLQPQLFISASVARTYFPGRGIPASLLFHAVLALAYTFLPPLSRHSVPKPSEEKIVMPSLPPLEVEHPLPIEEPAMVVKLSPPSPEPIQEVKPSEPPAKTQPKEPQAKREEQPKAEARPEKIQELKKPAEKETLSKTAAKAIIRRGSDRDPQPAQIQTQRVALDRVRKWIRFGFRRKCGPGRRRL